jgi:hypothetical protein
MTSPRDIRPGLVNSLLAVLWISLLQFAKRIPVQVCRGQF